ncbi:MAG: hypothetical protein ACK5JT_01140 [Hyphomicrobiaceae bacterium]
MTTTTYLLASLGGGAITALFITFIFNLARSSSDNFLVRSGTAASLAALLVTSLIVFAFSFLASGLFKLLGNIPLALGGALIAFLAMNFASWFIFGARKRAAAPAGLPNAPV